MICTNLSHDTMLIGLCGELDDRNASSVRSEIDNALENSSFRRVIFDLSKLEFMDSTGIGVLLGRYKKLIGKKVSVFISQPNSVVNKVLDLSGIYGLMPKI